MHRPECSASALRSFADQVERRRSVVDAQLRRPGIWRGVLRRERVRRGTPDERQRYVAAFDTVIRSRMDPGLIASAEGVKHLHDLAVGGTEFRTSAVRTGGFRRFVPAQAVEERLAAGLAEIRTAASEPACLTAARLHLLILDVHPFQDGNGRTSRLVGSAWLAAHGGTSTLTVALEEAMAWRTTSYITAIKDFSYGRASRERCLGELLRLYLDNFEPAADFLIRRSTLTRMLLDHQMSETDIPSTLWRFDTGDHSGPALAHLAYRCHRRGIRPWADVLPDMTPRARAALAGCLDRLDEERKAEALEWMGRRPPEARPSTADKGQQGAHIS